MSRVRLEDACVRDATGRNLLNPLSIEITSGETIVVCGASGAGKSLLIELVSGLRRPDHGRVLKDGRDVHRIAPGERGIGLLTQDAALYDHLGIRENIGFGIRRNGLAPDAINERIVEAARAAACTELLNRTSTKAATLSGGERRRVALAKALASDADVLLLDEPLEGLDRVTHDTIRVRLRALLQRREGVTIIALHDRSDAIALGDRILLLEEGSALQFDTPEELLRAPSCVRAAQLFSNPSPSVLEGRIGTGCLELPGGSIEYQGDLPEGTLVDVVIPAHAASPADEEGLEGWVIRAYEPTSTGVDLLLAHESDPAPTLESMIRVSRNDRSPENATGSPVRVILERDGIRVFARSETTCQNAPSKGKN